MERSYMAKERGEHKLWKFEVQYVTIINPIIQSKFTKYVCGIMIKIIHLAVKSLQECKTV